MLVQQMRLESATDAELNVLMQGLASWTTDLGTEAGFADSLAAGVRERLGAHFCRPALRADVGDGNTVCTLNGDVFQRPVDGKSNNDPIDRSPVPLLSTAQR